MMNHRAKTPIFSFHCCRKGTINCRGGINIYAGIRGQPGAACGSMCVSVETVFPAPRPLAR